MARFPFIGPSYVHTSVAFDAQRCINLYTSLSETGNSSDAGLLIGTPGLKIFIDLPKNIIRGAHEVLGRCFVVAGNSVYEIFIDGSYIFIGDLISLNGHVSMADNGLQVCLVDGDNGYIINLANDATWPNGTAMEWPDGTLIDWPSGALMETISDPDFVGADTVTFADGYFAFNEPNTGRYYISELYNGLNIDSLEFASAEGSTDNLVAVKAVHNELWLFGVNSIEVAYNSANLDFPYERIQGAFIEYGCIAPFSVAKAANTVFWLGNDKRGVGVVWMAEGYAPKRISTDAIEREIQSYADISDAISYTYQEMGHHFFVINFPAENTTLVYDISTGMWHERASLNNGNIERHRAQVHVYIFNKHIVGDYHNGKLYQQNIDFYTDDGDPIYRERTCPYLSDQGDLDYFFFNRFQLEMESGVGLSSNDPYEADPQIALSWSDDNARTWSNEIWRSAGKIGEYAKRLIWRRLGRSRKRVFKVSTSIPCKVCFISASVKADRGDT